MRMLCLPTARSLPIKSERKVRHAPFQAAHHIGYATKSEPTIASVIGGGGLGTCPPKHPRDVGALAEILLPKSLREAASEKKAQ